MRDLTGGECISNEISCCETPEAINWNNMMGINKIYILLIQICKIIWQLKENDVKLIDYNWS